MKATDKGLYDLLQPDRTAVDDGGGKHIPEEWVMRESPSLPTSSEDSKRCWHH